MSTEAIQQFKPNWRSRLALGRAWMFGMMEWLALLRARWSHTA